jgi:hypothetical protein
MEEWSADAANYSKRIFECLNRYHCKARFDRLVKLGAKEDELLRRLRALATYSPGREPRTPKTRTTRAQAKKIRSAADLMESLNREPHSALLLESDWKDTRSLPDKLRRYATRLEQLPKLVDPRWEPIKVALISQLVWYVKQSTGRYRDTEVSALIAALLYSGNWDPESLKQWRTRYKVDISKAGPLEVLPVTPSRSRTR